MNAEIITIGTELLLGHIVDTNAAYLAQKLASIGVDLFFKTTVGDNVERIAGAIAQSASRSDVVITTGGLGPTVDDMTRDAVARATGRPLTFSPDAWAEIQELFARWGKTPDENNRRQAMLPENSVKITNPVGTAPAFIVEMDSSVVISLPGVPRELVELTESRVLPYLKQRLGSQQGVIKSRVLRTVNLGESAVDMRIADLETAANPTVGLAAHTGQVDVRITAKANTIAEADALIAPVELELRKRLGTFIFGVDEESLEDVVLERLTTNRSSLAIIESNTDGDVAARLQRVARPGVLRQSFVANNSTVLATQLQAPALQNLGWPSAALASETAWALRQHSGCNFVLVVIGSLEQAETMYHGEPGETFVALADANGTLVRRYAFGGRGDVTRRWVGNRALDLLRRHIFGLPLDQ